MPPRTLHPAPARDERAPLVTGRDGPSRGPLTSQPRRSPTGRVTRRALVASLVLHLVLGAGILLLPVIRPSGPPAPPAADPVQYMDISAFPSAGTPAAGTEVPFPSNPSLPAGPAETSARPDTGSAGAPALSFPSRVPAGIPAGAGGEAVEGVGTGTGSGGGQRGGAAGGRLGAQFGDRRLVVTPGEVVERPMTDDERYQERLRTRLGAVNDSISDAAARQRRLRNWTVRDRSGREWGLGPDGSTIIAGRRVPLPLPLPVIRRDRDADNAERERVRRWGEIQDQAETQDRDAVLRERARETRRRIDNARRQERGEAVADTTRRDP